MIKWFWKQVISYVKIILSQRSNRCAVNYLTSGACSRTEIRRVWLIDCSPASFLATLIVFWQSRGSSCFSTNRFPDIFSLNYTKNFCKFFCAFLIFSVHFGNFNIGFVRLSVDGVTISFVTTILTADNLAKEKIQLSTQRPNLNPKLRYNNRSLLRMPWRACQYSLCSVKPSPCVHSWTFKLDFHPPRMADWLQPRKFPCGIDCFSTKSGAFKPKLQPFSR